MAPWSVRLNLLCTQLISSAFADSTSVLTTEFPLESPEKFLEKPSPPATEDTPSYARHSGSKVRYRDYLERVAMSPSQSPLGGDGGPPFGDDSYSLLYVDAILRHGTRMPSSKKGKYKKWLSLLQDSGLWQALYGRAKNSSLSKSSIPSILDLIEDDADSILVDEGWREHISHGQNWAHALSKYDAGRSAGNIVFATSERPRCVTSAKAFRAGLFGGTAGNPQDAADGAPPSAAVLSSEQEVGKEDISRNALEMQREYIAKARAAAAASVGKVEDWLDGVNSILLDQLAKDTVAAAALKFDSPRMRFFEDEVVGWKPELTSSDRSGGQTSDKNVAKKGKDKTLKAASDIAKRQLAKFLKSQTFLEVTRRVLKSARTLTKNSNLKLFAEDVADLFDLGSQEFAVLGQSPILRALFTDAQDVLPNEYINDLKHFYKLGPGNPDTRRWLPPFFNDWLDSILGVGYRGWIIFAKCRRAHLRHFGRRRRIYMSFVILNEENGG